MHKRGGTETEVREVGWRDFTLYTGVDFMLFGWIPLLGSRTFVLGTVLVR